MNAVKCPRCGDVIEPLGIDHEFRLVCPSCKQTFSGVEVQERFPEQIPRTFGEIGAAIGNLVEVKDAQYGSMCDAIAGLLSIYYPNGIEPKDYFKVGLVVRISDKLGRLTRGNGKGDEDAFADIAGYGIIGTAKMRNDVSR